MGQSFVKNLDFHERTLISIVTPVFNEAAVLNLYHDALTTFLKIHHYHYEVIYIDDGSTDNSFSVLKTIQERDHNISVIKLSRNFGKESAITAGLNVANGDAIIIMDCDLQDPPHLIPLMVDAWQSGADVVNMHRTKREGDSYVKKFTAKYFYKLMRRISDVDFDENVGDFRLLSRKVVNAINQLPETNRFMKGIFSWVGFNKVAIDYVRAPRKAGSSKWPYWKLWNLALDGITSFSSVPLKVFAYFGFFISFGSFLMGAFFLCKTFLFGEVVRGFPTLYLTMLFMGGIQLMSLGIIGEYIARIFIEVKNRPVYLIDEQLSHVKQSIAASPIQKGQAHLPKYSDY